MSDDLVGRADERHRIASLVRDARNGIGGSLLVRGEPGIGKTSLLAGATGNLNGVRVVRVDGYEAESAVAYGALHRLVAPWRALLDGLIESQGAALRTVLGLHAGPPPDRYLVGLAVLELVAAAGRAEPLVCVVDDAHWLDAESLAVIAFVARRLGAESVALVLAARDDERVGVALAGVPSLLLGGLDPESATRLLLSRLQGIVDPLVVARVVRSTEGNPLALVDLAQELTVQELAASGLGEEPIPIGRHLESFYLRRVREAGPDVRSWLLVAAAESTGSADLIAQACDVLDIDPGAAEAAEDLGLVGLGSVVRFRHPLVRAAAYGAARGSDRRRAHGALSAVAGRARMVELEAWHSSKSILGVDENVADRLERVADAAGARGGFVSRARVLGRAAELTQPGVLRDRRRLDAAEAAAGAGAAQIASGLLDELDEALLGPGERARVVMLRVSLALFTGDPGLLVRATAEMLRAAELVHGLDPEHEQHALIRAFDYALTSERSLSGVTLAELGRRLCAGADLRPGCASDVLRALGALILLPYGEAVPVLRQGLETIGSLEGPELLRYMVAGVALTTALWRSDERDSWLARSAQAARDAGSLQMLDTCLWISSLAELTGGTPRRAGEYVEQVRDLRRAIGYDAEQVVNAAYLVWIGAPRGQVERVAAGALAAGYGGVESTASWALAVRDLADGHYRDAYRALKPLIDDPFLQTTPLQVPDFVEAAARSGHEREAEAHTVRLEEMAHANGSPWTRGVALRCRALVTDGPGAEPHFRAAVAALDAARLEVEAARCRLLYGEWLRRARRRGDARLQLRAAAVAFEAAGAARFVERARVELEATGSTGARGTSSGPVLSPREATIARLAARGDTNAEIGATLFISVNTVDYHLRKVFQKLGISSRRQLRDRAEGGAEDRALGRAPDRAPD